MTAANDPLPVPSGASPTVVGSVCQAISAAGIDFGALMAQAKQESGFRVDAMASGSSATGLVQFLNSTWLSLVQRFGEKYGIGKLARQITTDPTGYPLVANPALRDRILDLRNDAPLSAALAAEYARANKAALESELGRAAGNAELYLAHFLGAGGATALVKAATQNGDAVGATLLPRAAAAHRAVFYDAGGRARSVAEIYEVFAQRIDGEAQSDARKAGAPATTADVPAFISRLGFHGQQLRPAVVIMLNAFALSALQLLANPRPLAAPERRAL